MPTPTPPPYNPAGWTTDPATWPPPIPPAVLYQPGMVWTMTGPGTVAGQPVAAGDLLFVVHRARLFGDDLFGAGQYGSPPGQDWTVEDVGWLAWYASAPPAGQPPWPYTGCPFGATGWWVVLEAWFLEDDAARVFGTGTFGDDVFGGGIDATPRWRDITPGFTEVAVTRGNDDGNSAVDALDIRGTWYDPDWSKWDLAPPAVYHRPFIGAPLRVSLVDPLWRWYPRATGEVEQITDAHGAPPRFVTVQAFGHVMDLACTLVNWQRPAELASARFAALLTAGGWRYGLGDLVYPTVDTMLHADLEPRTVTARDEIDRTAASAGWQFDTDLYGLPRLRVWPIALPAAPDAVVVDCADHGDDAVVASVITYTADQSQLLNVATTTNMADPPLVATARDDTSVALYNVHDNALGWPRTDLAWADQATGDALAARVRDRYSRIVTHVAPIIADNLVDAGWLPVLAAADTGAYWSVVRVHPDRWETDALLVGLDETITPDRYEATAHTTTTTPTN